MFDNKRYLRNIAFNWGAFFISIAVGFFQAPFLVRNLGDSGYGYWSLIATAIAYFGYFDLGIQSSVGYHVALHLADKDGESLNDKVNSALTALMAVGAVVLVACLGASVVLPRIFNIPAVDAATVRTAFILMGLVTGAKFPFSVFHAMLVGSQRYDIVSGVSAAVKVINAIGIMAVLTMGEGLAGLAALVATTRMAEGLVLAWFARRAVPTWGFRLFRFRYPSFRAIFTYGFFNFILNVSSQLGAGFWTFILARKLGAAAVTYYSIGAELLPYVAGVAGAVTLPLLQAVIPMDVADDLASIRSLYLRGTRYLFALVSLICTNLLLVGEHFLSQWMGPKYLLPEPYGSSGMVLTLLTLASMAALSGSVAQQILYGRRKNRLMAAYIAMESVCLIIWALILVPRYGIIGMALATLIPTVFFQGLMIPALAGSHAGASLGEYLRKGILPNLAVTAAICLIGKPLMAYVPHGSWITVVLSFTVVTSAFVAAAWFFLLDKEHVRRLVASAARNAYGAESQG